MADPLPNPFYDVCTLAICKPGIRRTAEKGDYVIGLAGAKYRKKGDWPPIVYAMQVGETMTFEEYWRDQRFRAKRPNMKAGGEKALGDNIYHKDSKGDWIQEESCHSKFDGTPDMKELKTDTSGENVLIAGISFTGAATARHFPVTSAS